MRWTDLCTAYPAQWLVIEKRLDDEHAVTVIEVCGDGRAAMHRFRELHHELPGRRLCCLHTSYPSLSFDERASTEVASGAPRSSDGDHHVS